MKKRQSKLIRYFSTLLFGFVLFNLIWYALAYLVDMSALPFPKDVYLSYEKAMSNGIDAHVVASMRRIGLGILVSLILATFLGVLMGYYAKINRALTPLLYFSYPLPKLAFLPIIMLLFGIGDLSKILIIILIIVFQITITIRDAIRNIPKENYDVLVSLRASTLQKVWHVTIPAVLSEVFSSLRIAIGIALSALFFAESFGTDEGLGFYINDSWMRLDYAQMYFGILILSFIGLVLFLILDWLDFIVHRWKEK